MTEPFPENWIDALRAGELTAAQRGALATALEGSFSLNLNMNDTFGFACADTEELDLLGDFPRIGHIVAEYGHHALTAYTAIKRGEEPIHCRCGHDGPPYLAARRLIEEVLATDG